MPTGSTARRTAEAGFTLPFLIGVLTVLAIVLGAAVPRWAAVVQRQKEAELVARGLQYAEAIRVFQRRFGRLPSRLEELLEVEPRSIRRLWKNPMAQGEDRGWLVLMEVGGKVVPLDPVTGQVIGLGGGVGEDGGEGGETEPSATGAAAGSGSPAAPPAPTTVAGGRAPRGAAPVAGAPAPGISGPGVAGPIHGVRSRVRGEAYRVFFEQKNFGDWEFTVERLQRASGATGPSGLLRRADYDSIGRPFPYPPPGGKGSSRAAPSGEAKSPDSRGAADPAAKAEPPATDDSEDEE